MADGVKGSTIWRERVLKERGAAKGTLKPRTRDLACEWDGGKRVWPPPLWPAHPLWQRQLPPTLSRSMPALPNVTQAQAEQQCHEASSTISARSCASIGNGQKGDFISIARPSTDRWKEQGSIARLHPQSTAGKSLPSTPVRPTTGEDVLSAGSTQLAGSPWSTKHNLQKVWDKKLGIWETALNLSQHTSSSRFELRSTNHCPINPAMLPVTGHPLPRGSGLRALNPFDSSNHFS